MDFTSYFLTNISQGSVATHLRCVGIFNECCIANFLDLKSANIWWSYVYSILGSLFLAHPVCKSSKLLVILKRQHRSVVPVQAHRAGVHCSLTILVQIGLWCHGPIPWRPQGKPRWQQQSKREKLNGILLRNRQIPQKSLDKFHQVMSLVVMVCGHWGHCLWPSLSNPDVTS